MGEECRHYKAYEKKFASYRARFIQSGGICRL